MSPPGSSPERPDTDLTLAESTAQGAGGILARQLDGQDPIFTGD